MLLFLPKLKPGLLLVLLLSAFTVAGQEPTRRPAAAQPQPTLVAPINPPLPGEELLSAQERAERDFLMPPRRRPVSSDSTRRPAPGYERRKRSTINSSITPAEA